MILDGAHGHFGKRLNQKKELAESQKQKRKKKKAGSDVDAASQNCRIHWAIRGDQ